MYGDLLANGLITLAKMNHYLQLVYRNVIRTDGVDIEFLFKKSKLAKHDVTPADFHTWIRDNEDKITVWGVYPGVTDMFVAVDLSDYEHRIRKTSTRE
jgi:hypothetical protein